MLAGSLPALAGSGMPPEPQLYGSTQTEPPIYAASPQGYGAADRSCAYVRVDAGYAFSEDPNVTTHSLAFDDDVDDGWFIEGGLGCRVTPYFRADVTVGYRHNRNLSDALNTLDADVSSVTGMVNGYWDIADFNGFVPYVGVGVGIAANTFSNVDLPPNLSNKTVYNVAYALMAGFSYDVSDRMTFDAGYRFIDLGTARSDGADRLWYRNVNAHDIRIGLRYNFE